MRFAASRPRRYNHGQSIQAHLRRPVDTAPEMPDFEIHLPAIRGIQAERPFYIALCPAKFIPRLIPQDSPEPSEESPFDRAARPQSLPGHRPIPGQQSGILCSAGDHLSRRWQGAFRRARGERAFLRARDSASAAHFANPDSGRYEPSRGYRDGFEIASRARRRGGSDPVLCRFQSEPRRADPLRHPAEWVQVGPSQGILCDLRDETAGSRRS